MNTSIYKKPSDDWWSRFLSLYDPHPKKMLDLGFGHGRYTQWFADHGFSVIGVEADQSRFNEVNKRMGRLTRIKLIRGDIANLSSFDLEPRSFGIIFDRNSSQFVGKTSQEDYFRTIAKLLSPTGVFVYSIVQATDQSAPDFIANLPVTPAETLPIIEHYFKTVKKIVRPSTNLPGTTATDIIARPNPQI